VPAGCRGRSWRLEPRPLTLASVKSPRTYRLPNGDRLVEKDWAQATCFLPDPDGRFPINAHADGTFRSAPLFIEPRTFELVAPSGETRAFYGHPSTSPLDDYLYIMRVYFVRDGKLVRATLEMGGRVLRTRIADEQVRLEGLVLEEAVL
jgi:hypothetical protein